MPYTVEGLERSRGKGFRPKHLFGLLLKEFLGLSDDLRIVDLGCGSGFFTRILAQQCDAEITGIDVDEGLLAGARRLAREEGLTIEFEVGDINDVGYEDEAFDIVMCAIMLEHFQDATVPLREMARVCRKGGTVVTIEPFYKSFFQYYPEVDGETSDLLLRWCRADKPYGLGPKLPYLFDQIGLVDIDLVAWFWGHIGYSTLELETMGEKLHFMEENLRIIREFLPRKEHLSEEEKLEVITFFENRLHEFQKSPDELKNDMSVTGLPVFVVKGRKQ